MDLFSRIFSKIAQSKKIIHMSPELPKPAKCGINTKRDRIMGWV